MIQKPQTRRSRGGLAGQRSKQQQQKRKKTEEEGWQGRRGMQAGRRSVNRQEAGQGHEISCCDARGGPSLLPGWSSGFSSLLLSSSAAAAAAAASAAVGGRSGGTHPVGSRQCSETAMEARRLIQLGASCPVSREQRSLEK